MLETRPHCVVVGSNGSLKGNRDDVVSGLFQSVFTFFETRE